MSSRPAKVRRLCAGRYCTKISSREICEKEKVFQLKVSHKRSTQAKDTSLYIANIIKTTQDDKTISSPSPKNFTFRIPSLFFTNVLGYRTEQIKPYLCPRFLTKTSHLRRTENSVPDLKVENCIRSFCITGSQIK